MPFNIELLGVIPGRFLTTARTPSATPEVPKRESRTKMENRLSDVQAHTGDRRHRRRLLSAEVRQACVQGAHEVPAIPTAVFVAQNGTSGFAITSDPCASSETDGPH